MTVGMAFVFWLMPGPRHLTARVVLDLHSLIFGVIFTLLGAQIVSVGCFAKVFSYAERFDRGQVSMNRALRKVKLEHGLVLGVLLALMGLSGDLWVVFKWAAVDFGPLYSGDRAVLFWSMWLVLGVQIIFSSFFLSMLGISRGTYIGDYEKQR
jgi:hypothetical protein